MPSPGFSRTGARHAAVVLVLTALAVAAWTFAGIPSPSGSPAPSRVVSAAGQLAGAEGSLGTGAGPAGGKGASCTGSGFLSVRCGASPPSPAAGPGAAIWTNVTNLARSNPGTFIEGAMTWDASDGYVLLWGGFLGGFRFNETWTYLNGTWTNLTPRVTGGHPPVYYPALAYDPSTRVVIEFGGNSWNGGSRATWSYHNLVWTNITSTAGAGPDRRLFFGFSEDSTDQDLVLFGGQTSGTSDGLDTWTFKNGHWSNITATAGFPAPGLALFPFLSDDPAISGVLLVCLTKASVTGYIEGTYAFRAGVWTNLTATLAVGPPPSMGGTLSWFGQGSAVVYSAAYVYNHSLATNIQPVSWAFYHGAWVNLSSQLIPPASFEAGSASLGDGSLIVYGGYWLFGIGSVVNWTYILSEAPGAGPLVATPSVTDLGMAINFTDTPQGGISPVSGNFTFGDGTSTTGLSRAARTYAQTGAFSANYTVTDWLGRTGTAYAKATVNPDVAITTEDASGTSPTAGTNVLFAATVTGGTGGYVYAWSFGDGTTSPEAAPTHNWTRTGSFTVALTVTDAVGGHASKSLTVSVSAVGFSWTMGLGQVALLTLVGVGVAVVSVLGTVLFLRRRRGSGGTGGSPTAGSPPGTSPTRPPPGAASSPPPPDGPPPGTT